ncbi:Predicted lipid-binding transport protein, Tim44 family [Halopseudomonas formosensis]|uniref:Predicted lipid-binding transport protein, Tim44 family n=1 Tax=Halopseudomonas formosensis TaxID=1002526 RepID=A0A1I6BSQ7_9GAMM|nr:TIM44-like domain-containing protein [Halopseudomonas formosensis]SFQ83887.1 Predicted lipid-binding transport protein, Tim44 family [Halopseudomonas formosensis]
MRWLLPFFAVFLMVGLTVPDAEARRMGGGKSFGAAPMHKSQPAQRQQAPQQATPRNQQTNPAATSGASRWLGPLAGIAAGGLLASMLFGDGFQGLQLFDILIFGLLAFVLFKLFSRRNAPAMQRQPHPAGGPVPAPQQQPVWPSQSASAQPAAAPVTMDAPAWFDADSFLKGAEEHFYTLQRHWRDNDVAGMAEYLDPALLQQMLAERSANPPSSNGFVEQLEARLEGIEQREGRTIATVGFTGVDREFPTDEGEHFDESWRLERADGDNQPWIICGIRQN